MKAFLTTLITFLIVMLFWSAIGMKSINKTDFISPSVLDMAKPLNVSIDVDFIKGLNPANGK